MGRQLADDSRNHIAIGIEYLDGRRRQGHGIPPADSHELDESIVEDFRYHKTDLILVRREQHALALRIYAGYLTHDIADPVGFQGSDTIQMFTDDIAHRLLEPARSHCPGKLPDQIF
jgi:hypothetical protein